MLLPSKHLKLSGSLIGFGAFILALLKGHSLSVDTLWQKYELERDSKRYPTNHDYETFIITLGYLYSIGVLVLDSKGAVKLCA